MSAKKITYDQEAREGLRQGVKTLARAVKITLGPRGRDGGLKEGLKLRILMAPAGQGPGQRLQPYRVIVANDSTIEAVAALSDLGKYVAVDVQSMNTVTEAADASDDDEDDGTGVRLYQSIYETAMRNKVPASVTPASQAKQAKLANRINSFS